MKTHDLPAVFDATGSGCCPSARAALRLSAAAPEITSAHPRWKRAFGNPLPIAGMLLACGLALFTASCASTTRAAPPNDFHSYAIIAVDDRGILSQAEMARIQIGIVQYLVSQGYVHSGQVFTTVVVYADVVFQVRIAWQGGGNSFAVVDVAPTYGGNLSAYDNGPYDPWFEDDYYDYGDFGYAYDPYVPFLAIAPLFPFFDYSYHSRLPHRRSPWRDGDPRHPSPPHAGDHSRSPALPPRSPYSPRSNDHQPPPTTWRSRGPAPDRRPPPTGPSTRKPDGSGPDYRPLAPHPPGWDSQKPPSGHRPPTASRERPRPSGPNDRPAPRDPSARPPSIPGSTPRPPPSNARFADSPGRVSPGRPPPPPSGSHSAGNSRGSVSNARPSSPPAPPPARSTPPPSSSDSDSPRNAKDR